MRNIPNAKLQLCCWLLLCVFVSSWQLHAADTTATARFIDKFTLAPVGALKTADLNGESQWGAGLDLGYTVNKFVSLHVANLAFEADDWGGSAVDETDVYAKAKLTRFSNDTVTLYALGGGQYEWNERAFGIGVGGGISLNVHKNVSLAADYSVRAWFSDLEGGQSADGLLRLLANISF